MDREFLETLKPFLGTRPPYGVFAIEDGSGWFCSSCGRKSDTTIVTHKRIAGNALTGGRGRLWLRR